MGVKDDFSNANVLAKIAFIVGLVANICNFAAVQACAVLGFVALNIGFLLVILFMCWGSCKQNSEVAMASAILFIVSALMWFVAVVVFGANFYREMKNSEDDPSVPFASFISETDLGFSFGLAICALALALMAGVFMFLGRRGIPSTGIQ